MIDLFVTLCCQDVQRSFLTHELHCIGMEPFSTLLMSNHNLQFSLMAVAKKEDDVEAVFVASKHMDGELVQLCGKDIVDLSCVKTCDILSLMSGQISELLFLQDHILAQIPISSLRSQAEKIQQWQSLCYQNLHLHEQKEIKGMVKQYWESTVGAQIDWCSVRRGHRELGWKWDTLSLKFQKDLPAKR